MAQRQYRPEQYRQSDLAGLAPVMLALLKTNIASDTVVLLDPNGVPSRPGCVIASPSYRDVTDQNYVHCWTRDAAVTAVEVARALPAGNGVDRTLCDYVAFAETCQASAEAAGRFFVACFRVDGAVRDGWSEQKDGPALQSLAFVEAWPFLDAPARAAATRAGQRNLEQVVARWADDENARGPWEDVVGASFFARAAQVRFLEEVASGNTLSLTAPAAFDAALAGLRTALDAHWDPHQRRYVSIRDAVAGDPDILDLNGFDPNVDVVMASIYGSIPVTDPRLLATAAQVRAAFDVGGSTAYPINAEDRARGIGPLIGRYPSDAYDGTVADDADHPTRDHPWALCTANVAELYYRLAAAFRAGAGAGYDELTGPFFDQLGLDRDTVDEPGGGAAVAGVLREAGDRMLQAVIFHSDHYALSEQFDAVTGFERSVRDLTWSYAAYLSAVRARRLADPGTLA